MSFTTDNAVLTPIGVVHSQLRLLEDCPKQEFENAPPAEIEIFPEYLEAISDLKAGDKIIILTWLDRAKRNVLKTKPRDNPAAKLTGVFSTRSPDRPNPIGLHSATVTAVSDNRFVKVACLEVLDRTPILDIKPDIG